MSTEQKENPKNDIDNFDSNSKEEVSLEKNNESDEENDSLEKQMEKMKESKRSESNRPQSKYQKDRISSSKMRKEEQKEQPLNVEDFLSRLNAHLQSNKITRKKFAGSMQSTFIGKDGLKDYFDNIKFNITDNELKYVFEKDNKKKDEGFAYLKDLLDSNNFNFYINEDEEEDDDEEEEELGESKSKSESINTRQLDNANNAVNINNILENKMMYDINRKKEVEDDFAMFKNDILAIVENKPSRPKSKHQTSNSVMNTNSAINNKKRNASKPQSAYPNHNRIIVSEKNEQNKYNDDINYYVNNINANVNKQKPKPKKVNYLKQTLKRERLEEDMVKLTLDKRNKEFQRDCVEKMVLANKYAAILGRPENYSAYCEEGESTIVCKVFNSVEKKIIGDISLKKFLFEFRSLEKKIKENEERKKYKTSNEEEVKDNVKQEFVKMDRKERLKIIKKTLKESLELKILLKKQLKALRDKGVIDINIINKNLRLTNLDNESII